MPLAEKIERLTMNEKILSELKFDNLKEILEESIHEGMGQNFTQMRLLKMNFIDRLMVKTKRRNPNHKRGNTIVF